MSTDLNSLATRQIQIVGVNHETAPLDIRDQLALRPDRTEALGAHLRTALPVEECVFVSTCNRAELYLAGPEPATLDATVEALCGFTGANVADVREHSYQYAQDECVRHLFRVASSLDSMILGETEILGQVKQAYGAAADAGCTGKTLNALFQLAFNVAKQVRTDTPIGEGHVSVPSVAVDFALRIFTSLADKTSLVIGAGEAAEGVVKALFDHGATALMVANRTYDRAVNLSKQYHGSAIRFDQLARHLEHADVVVGSSAAPHTVVSVEEVREARRRRRNRTMLFLDISTPRDIDPAVGDLENVYLYNLDDLKEVVDEHQDKRHQAMAAANTIIDAAVSDFMARLNAPEIGPTIAAVRESWRAVMEAEVDRTLSRLNGVNDRDREEVRAMAERIVNKLLHQPMREVRTAATDPDGHHLLHAFRRLLHLDPSQRRS